MIPQQSPSEKKAIELEILHPTLDRKKYLGGTDAAALCGLSRWKSPLQVWAEKTGRLKEEDISDRLPVKLGNKLEQTVCELFMEETGKILHRVNETVFHPKHPYLAANLDRRVVGEDALFEAKTCSAWRAKEWENDETPMEYLFQVLHYLLVTGKEKAYLAVLIGNQEFKWKLIERNEKLLNDLLKREIEFWKDYVEKDVMPLVMTKYDGDTLSKLFPVAQEKEVALGDEANILIDNLKALESDQRSLEGLIEQHKNQLKVMLKDAARGFTSLNEVRWINSQMSRLDAKALLETMPEIHKRFYRSTPLRRFVYGAIKTSATH